MSKPLTASIKLDRTKELIQGTINVSEPYEALVHVLESVIELLRIPDNNFLWSYWEDSDEATQEITKLLNQATAHTLPKKVEVAVLFVAAGPLQEVSLSSGWGELFLEVAKKFDQVEKLLWPND